MRFQFYFFANAFNMEPNAFNMEKIPTSTLSQIYILLLRYTQEDYLLCQVTKPKAGEIAESLSIVEKIRGCERLLEPILVSYKTIIMPLWEKAMVTHSSSLAWRIPWTEEPGGRQSMGSRRVRYD